MKLKTVMFVILCIVCGIGIYQIKFQVRERENRLANIEKKINEQKQSIHMLEAEWSLLTAPDRLKKLADKTLDLQPAKAHRIVSFADIPDKKPVESDMENSGSEVGSNLPHERLPEGFINSSLAATSPVSDDGE